MIYDRLSLHKGVGKKNGMTLTSYNSLFEILVGMKPSPHLNPGKVDFEPSKNLKIPYF